MYEYCCLKYCCCDIVLFGSVAFSTFAVETVVACNTIAVAADVVAVVHYWRGILYVDVGDVLWEVQFTIDESRLVTLHSPSEILFTS